MAESPAIWKQGAARPLEPDAGNAAEGSEGPMPDWLFQPCDFSARGFFMSVILNEVKDLTINSRLP